MELKFLVQVPGTNAYRAVAVEASDAPLGTDLRDALRQVFDAPAACWKIQGQPLDEIPPGSQHLASGALLVASAPVSASKPERLTGSLALPARNMSTSDEPLFTLTVLNGPDSLTTFPLWRGSWSVGRNNPDITLADPALAAIEAELEVYHSHLLCRTSAGDTELTVGSPFWLGNSLLVVQPGHATVSAIPRPAHTAQEAQEVDIPARRNPWVLTAMIAFPLIIGVTIALLTSMWLILLMSVGSSLLMGVHTLASGGESKKTRQLIEKTARTELETARNLAHPVTPQGNVLLGICRRPANIRGKNRDIDRLPLLDAVPHYQDLTKLGKEPIAFPLPTLRFFLLQLPQHYPGLAVLLTDADTDTYRTLVEPLLALPQVEPIRAEELSAGKTINSPLLADASVPHPPLTQQHPVFRLRCTGQATAPSYPEPVLAPTPQLDGISETTYRALISTAAGDCNSLHSLATRTSEIPDFARPLSPVAPSTEDIYFTLGTDTTTGQPLRYGLNRHGPHFLCAGTTGSGKSQLLRSILWSAALGNSPSRLALILIDFKGGAGLGPLASLPHCKTLISDLDSSGLTRSLKYLRADLKNREHHFSNLGLSSYTDYLTHCTTTGSDPNYPEVLLCIDEFRMLVDDYPDILTEFMRIATIGRSLGYHLILATQRPQGAISQDIRANIATSICLRVGSAQDSFNVLAAEDAAHIPADRPGAGYVRDSDHQLIAFQAPLIDGHYAPARGITSARLITSVTAINLSPDSATTAFDDTALTRVCSELAAGTPPTRYTPILPVPEPSVPHAEPYVLNLGTVEIPELGTQTPWMWQAHEGACLLQGTLTERSPTVLATLGAALAAGYEAVCITSSEQFAQRVTNAYPAQACSTYSLKDLDFVRTLLGQLAAGTTTPVFLLIDGLEAILDLLPRYPDTEAHLHELLMPIGETATVVYCTAATAPRGKFSQLFAHTLITPNGIEHDPVRSHQKNYNRPPAGALALEGSMPHALSAGTVTASILYPPLPPQGDLPTGMPSASYRQLPASLSVQQLLEDSRLQDVNRPVCGAGRHGPVQLPHLSGGFMAVSGARGSGKSTLLTVLSQLAPGTPSIMLTASDSTTLEHVTTIISRAEASQVKPQLLIDDLHRLESDAQHLILQHRSAFERVVVTYTPWPRWSTSPVLSALSGTETGIVLRPESVADLSFYSGGSLPLDLKTGGRVPPGRGLLLNHGELTPFQVPLPLHKREHPHVAGTPQVHDVSAC